MRTFFEVVGVGILIAYCGGAVGAWDFRLCIGAVGTCNPISHVSVAGDK
jgi:hypothetical protein